MRVGSIKLSLNNKPMRSCLNESFLSRKDSIESGNFSSSGFRCQNSLHPGMLAFSGVICCFRPEKGNYIAASNREAKRLEHVNDFKKDEPPAEEILSIFSKAKEVESSLPLILDRFRPVYEDANTLASSFKRKFMLDDTRVCNSRRNITMNETDGDDNIIKTAYFVDNELKMVKDFENNKIILFSEDSSDNKGKRMDVFLGCKDMENNDIIKSDEAFSFLSGKLYRYSTNCEKDISCDRFFADEAFTFKRNVFECYDYSLTIACGTEYANEYIGFKVRPGVEYTDVIGNLTPIRHVENKVAVKNRIIHSSKETVLTGYSDYSKMAEQA